MEPTAVFDVNSLVRGVSKQSQEIHGHVMIRTLFPDFSGALRFFRPRAVCAAEAAEQCHHSDYEEWWGFSPDHGCRS